MDGATRRTPEMEEFLDFIHEQHLIDLSMEGGRYTWLNNHEVPTWSWIDRFLVLTNWEEKFEKATQSILP